MTKLDWYAFSGCSSLRKVSLPYYSLIADSAFPAGCNVERRGSDYYINKQPRSDHKPETKT